MRIRVLTLLLACLSGIVCAQSNFAISVINSTGTSTITCSNPSIQLTGTSSYTAAPVIYLWVTPTSSFVNNASVAATSPGIYTLTATAGTLTSFTTVAISINTIQPVSSVSPSVQTIVCSPPSAVQVSLSALSPTSNVILEVLSATNATYTAFNFSLAYTPAGVGVYTTIVTNQTNGCKSIKNFTVNSIQGLPVFTLTSTPPNFTLGCSGKSVTAIYISNASATNSLQIPTGGPVTFTMLAPGSNTSLPGGNLSAISVYSINAPGNYTVVVRDAVTQCEARSPISVIMNTVSPVIDSITIQNPLLTCSNTQSTLKAFPAPLNYNFIWVTLAGTTQSTFATSNMAAVAVNTSVANTVTLNGTYTLTIVDNYNLCKTTTVVTLLKNTFPPKALFSINPPTGISCSSPTAMLVNLSLSSAPPFFPNSQPVIGYEWLGPAPQSSLGNSSTYTASTPGIYTLTALDLNNGCKSSTTGIVADNRIYPLTQNPIGDINILCPSAIALLTPTLLVQGPHSFSWTIPSGVTVPGPTNALTLTVTAAGIYTLNIKNTVSGCITTNTFAVVVCAGLKDLTSPAVEFTLLPNPAHHELYLDSSVLKDGAQIHIYDVIGQRMMCQGLIEPKQTVSVSELKAGVYFLTVRFANGESITRKFIKD